MGKKNDFGMDRGRLPETDVWLANPNFANLVLAATGLIARPDSPLGSRSIFSIGEYCEGERMASLKKAKRLRDLPANAEVKTRKGKRVAHWVSSNGTKQTAEVVEKGGALKIRVEGQYWIAKYRNSAGVVEEKSTGCRDKQAAQSVLNDILKRVEQIKANVLTPEQDRISDHQSVPLEDHFSVYVTYLQQRQVTAQRVDNALARLNEVADACEFKKLADLSPDKLETFLALQSELRRSASVYNDYVITWTAFGYWLAGKRIVGKQSRMTGEKRLLDNPFKGLAKVSEADDRRRRRRALTEQELTKLLDVARRRPLEDVLTIRRGPRKGELGANVRPAIRAEKELLGRERALIYKTMVLTGLRQRELKTLAVSDLSIADEDCAFVTVRSENAKNRTEADIPIRKDLAIEMKEWLTDKRRREGDREPAMTVFRVPDKLVRILDRDLAMAGIPKVDANGFSVDVHAFRHTFGTHLSKAGVAPRTAQAAMRHSTIGLTMNVYTDPRLLDVAGAIDSLPTLDSPPSNTDESEALRATGTDDEIRHPSDTPNNPPTQVKGGHSESSGVTLRIHGDSAETKENPGKHSVSRGSEEWAMRGSNPRPPRCKRDSPPSIDAAKQGVSGNAKTATPQITPQTLAEPNDSTVPSDAFDLAQWLASHGLHPEAAVRLRLALEAELRDYVRRSGLLAVSKSVAFGDLQRLARRCGLPASVDGRKIRSLCGRLGRILHGCDDAVWDDELIGRTQSLCQSISERSGEWRPIT